MPSRSEAARFAGALRLIAALIPDYVQLLRVCAPICWAGRWGVAFEVVRTYHALAWAHLTPGEYGGKAQAIVRAHDVRMQRLSLR